MARWISALAALLVVALLAAGVFVWQARVASVRTELEARTELARALLPTATSAETLQKALASANLRIAVEDHAANVVYDTTGATPRPIPPRPEGAEPPAGAQVVEAPLPAGFAQGPPGQGPPGQGPPNQGPPAQRRSKLAQLAGMAVGRAPMRLESGTLGVVIGPNVERLAAFMIADAIVTIAAVALTIGLATWIVAGLGAAARRQLEATLDERRAAAKEFQRFLADAGHELRTPLTIVSGYIEVLARDLETSEQGRQILDGMRTEATRMRALVEKMLLLARLESPVSVPRLVDVGNVAADVVQQMQARFPNREVILRASDRASIVIDHDDLYEALRNLVENALNYAPASPVEVAVQPDAEGASIAVIDHGAGIAPEEREKIFERFYRGSAQTQAEGSGLGLAIVSRVAEKWNGVVALQSRPGNTMFTLRFPLADEVPA